MKKDTLIKQLKAEVALLRTLRIERSKEALQVLAEQFGEDTMERVGKRVARDKNMLVSEHMIAFIQTLHKDGWRPDTADADRINNAVMVDWDEYVERFAALRLRALAE